MSVQLTSLESITMRIIAEARRDDPDPAARARSSVDVQQLIPTADQYEGLRSNLGERVALTRALGHITKLVLGSLVYTRDMIRNYAFLSDIRDSSMFPSVQRMHIDEGGGTIRIASIGELERIATAEYPDDPRAASRLFFEMTADKVRTVATILMGLRKAYLDEELLILVNQEKEKKARDPEHTYDERSLRRMAKADFEENFPTLEGTLNYLTSMLTGLRDHYVAWLASTGSIVRNGSEVSGMTQDEISTYLAGMRSDHSSPLGIFNMMMRGVHNAISGGTEKRIRSGQEEDYIENLRGDKGLQMGIVAMFDTALYNLGLGAQRGESRGGKGGLGLYDVERGSVARNFAAFSDPDTQTDIINMIQQAERVADAAAARRGGGLSPRQAVKFGEKMVASAVKAGTVIRRKAVEAGAEPKKAPPISVTTGLAADVERRAAELERGRVTAMQRARREPSAAARVQGMVADAAQEAMRSVERATRVPAGSGAEAVPQALAAFAAPVIRGLVDSKWCAFSPSDSDSTTIQGLQPGQMTSAAAAAVAASRRSPTRLRSQPSPFFLHNIIGLTNSDTDADVERRADFFNPGRPSEEEMERRGTLSYRELSVQPGDIAQALEQYRSRALPDAVDAAYRPHVTELQGVLRLSGVLPTRRDSTIEAVKRAYAHLGGRLSDLVDKLSKGEEVENLYEYVRESVLDPIRTVDIQAAKSNAARATVEPTPAVARSIEADVPAGPSREAEMAAAAREEMGGFYYPEEEEAPPIPEEPSALGAEEEEDIYGRDITESRSRRRSGGDLLEALHLKLLRRAAQANRQKAAGR